MMIYSIYEYSQIEYIISYMIRFCSNNNGGSLMRFRFPLLVLLLLISLLYAGCSDSNAGTTSSGTPATSKAAVTLNVFAAASLNASFKEIQNRFNTTHPNVTIHYNFAGSQQLVQQMINGASADVFASADTTNMQKAKDNGLVDSSQIFAKNRLVVIVSNKNNSVTTLKDLSAPGVKIDMGNPAVPAGKYALQALDKLGKSPAYGSDYESMVKKNVVSQEDNVTAVVNKVQLGEADAGFVYQTDVTASVASKVRVIDIPADFNVIAQYPIAALKKSAHLSDAQAFVQFVLSSQGQEILSKYRFISIMSNSGGQDQ